MQDEKRDDEVADEMPEAGVSPCGQIFGAETIYVTDADDIDETDDMPAPETRCGDQFGATQTVHETEVD